MNLQQTLVILKPDAVCRAYMGEIITRFEKVWFTIIGAKMVKPDKDFFHHHYETISKLGSRVSEEVLNNTIAMMMESPVLALVIEGVDAVENIRKIVGKTEPKSAQPGTIRGDFAHISYAYADATTGRINNLIHASGNAEEAIEEVKHWFKKEELFSYATVHAKFIR